VIAAFGGRKYHADLLMELSRIKALIDLLAGSAITELELSEGADHIRLSKVSRPSTTTAPAPALAAPAPASASNVAAPSETTVAAPMFGVVHLSPASGQPPFVAAGSAIKPGDTLCLIEAMKVFSPVLADLEGRVEAVLVADQTEVEANQALFRLGSQ
jgi:acetyl-CoA carboxylase biotin carboxyl carrier protein